LQNQEARPAQQTWLVSAILASSPFTIFPVAVVGIVETMRIWEGRL
jgi:hypothetical protein